MRPGAADRSSTFWRGIALTVGSSILWGSTYPAIQIALHYYNAYQISFFRAVFASLTLLIYLAVLFSKTKRGKSENFKDPRKHTFFLPRGRKTWSLLLVASFFGATGFWTLLNLSIQYLNADFSTFIVALYPIFGVVFASLFLRDSLAPTKLLGVVVGIIGAFVIVFLGESAKLAGSHVLLGIVCGLITALCFVVYMITTRTLIEGKMMDSRNDSALSPEYVTFVIFVIAIVPTLLVALAAGPADGTSLLSTSPAGLFLVLYLGIVTSAVAFLMFNIGMKIIGVGRAAINQVLFPAVSLALSYFFLGETINLPEAIGIALILAGIFIGQRRTRSEKVLQETPD